MQVRRIKAPPRERPFECGECAARVRAGVRVWVWQAGEFLLCMHCAGVLGAALIERVPGLRPADGEPA
jgi:hypothetical protein